MPASSALELGEILEGRLQLPIGRDKTVVTASDPASNAVKKAFRLFFRSENLSVGQEGLEKAPGSGPDRFVPIFSPVDQF